MSQTTQKTLEAGGQEKRSNYKDNHFAQNLVAASACKTLKNAAAQWHFSHFGEEDGYTHCQLCHSRMKLWVAIKNQANGVVLFIGHDCYDKLIAYLETEKLESVSLGSRKQYLLKVKRYCKEHITESFIAWCEGQKIPEEFKEALAFIKKRGYASTLEVAESLVRFYKETRRFSLGDLLDYSSHQALVVRSLFRGFPTETNPLNRDVTLAEFEKFDWGFTDGLSLEEVEDKFFQEALWKTAPPEISHDMAVDSATMNGWIENARRQLSEIIDVAWKRAVIDLSERIAGDQEDYLLLAFRKGVNPKYGTPQWEARDACGTKYVLHRETSYDPKESRVLVRVIRELVDGRVFLVGKLSLVPSPYGPRYSWIES